MTSIAELGKQYAQSAVLLARRIEDIRDAWQGVPYDTATSRRVAGLRRMRDEALETAEQLVNYYSHEEDAAWTG